MNQAQIDRLWMSRAIELSKLCPPSFSAFSVGAILIGSSGEELASGFSREFGPHFHAEEVVFTKLGKQDISNSTLYSTLEPCSQRKSSSKSCVELILAHNVTRVVIAWREPDLFVANCEGVEFLANSGVEVIELTEMENSARQVNAHLKCCYGSPGLA